MKKIFILAATFLSLVACDQNIDSPIASKVETKISATIEESVSSRTSGNTWVAGDRIGITGFVGTSILPHINMRYSTDDGGSVFKGNPIYYYNDMTLNAYYPFTGTEGTLPGNKGVITGNTGAENQKPANQSQIDYLWDTQTGFTVANPNVNFTFAHKMSKFTVVFKNGTRTNVEHIVGYELVGLALNGTFNTITGVCAGGTPAADESLMINLARGSVVNLEPQSPLILFPQKPGEDKVKLRVYLDEVDDVNHLQTYTCMLSFDKGELKSGHHYKYTIHLAKSGLITGEMTIDEWPDEELENGVATIDGSAFEDDEE